MNSSASGKSISRFVALLLVGLAFAATAMLLAQAEQSMFVDLPDVPVASAQLN
jgi:hypothetical protein